MPIYFAEPFHISIFLTGMAFFIIGAIKSNFILENWFIAGIETLFIGGTAALIAYYVGYFLQILV
jgi:VIT1/CCC1 family predicted Fe2+/Mn2+ transporter